MAKAFVLTYTYTPDVALHDGNNDPSVSSGVVAEARIRELVPLLGSAAAALTGVQEAA